MQDGCAYKVTHKHGLRKNRMQEDLTTDRSTNFLCLVTVKNSGKF
jgi:hypothetical protein